MGVGPTATSFTENDDAERLLFKLIFLFLISNFERTRGSVVVALDSGLCGKGRHRFQPPAYPGRYRLPWGGGHRRLAPVTIPVADKNASLGSIRGSSGFPAKAETKMRKNS